MIDLGVAVRQVCLFEGQDELVIALHPLLAKILHSVRREVLIRLQGTPLVPLDVEFRAVSSGRGIKAKRNADRGILLAEGNGDLRLRAGGETAVSAAHGLRPERRGDLRRQDKGPIHPPLVQFPRGSRLLHGAAGQLSKRGSVLRCWRGHRGVQCGAGRNILIQQCGLAHLGTTCASIGMKLISISPQ